MATEVQRRRGTTTEHATFTGADGELTVDTTKKTVVVHDGTTVGGVPLAREDLSNVDVAPSAITPGTARQLLQTDAAGTGVEWTSNVDVPGTLDVTSTATFDSIASHPLGSAGAPTITFTGDTNTGIYSPDADQLALSTNGTGRLFVDANGKVGLSEATPVARLHIAGTTTAGGIKIVDSSASNAAPGIEVIGKRSDSNASPCFAGKLLLSKNRLDAAIHATNRLGSVAFGGNHTDGSEANILYSASVVGEADGTFNSATDMPTALVFRTGSVGVSPDTANVDTGTERLRITSAGLVGIGTSAPAALLHLSSATGSATPTPTELRIATTSNASDWSSTDPWGRISFYSADGSNSGPKTHWAIDTTSRDVFGGLSDFQIKRNEGSGLLSTLSISALGTTTLTSGSSQEPLIVKIGTNEAARIDSSGRLLVGTSSSRAIGSGTAAVIQAETTSSLNLALTANRNDGFGSFLCLGKSRGTAAGGTTIVNSGDALGAIRFAGADGVDLESVAAEIRAEVDGTPGADDMPGRLVFRTTASGVALPTERMRISSDGTVFINKTVDDNTTSGFRFNNNDEASFVRDSNPALILARLSNNGGVAVFRRDTATVGSISVTTTATAYNTSSDYRLKENVTAVTDGITRLQQLKPSRFNFIADPAKTVDGFLAHEVQTVVPEAITGEKDAVDDEGNPEYQGIDQSKLVPLLTAALQEAIGEIESLKARVAALETP